MTLAEKQAELTRELSARRDSQERFAWLVERAKRLPALEDALRVDAHRVEGCLAKLWLVCEFTEGRCRFRCDADSMIVKAIASLLCEFYSDQTPAEILAHEPTFLGPLGVTQHLTPNRRNSLSRVWETIRAFAQQHAAADKPV